ncbi:MAG: hypothetical protein WDZ49_10130 [Litorilinea sp.]
MPNLIQLTDLTASDVRAIWAQAQQPPARLTRVPGSVAWSFEGNGIRTRTTFLQAFAQLGLNYIELPNLLQTGERVQDIAGYLDPFYGLYVIRAADHARLCEFAAASCRPVINAMSRGGHPCEVLADAAWVQSAVGELTQCRIALWGPPTNVFASWVELAQVLDFEIDHFCAPKFHTAKSHVRFHDLRAVGAAAVDLVITDGWPTDYAAQDPAAQDWSLRVAHLAQLGYPRLLPTPPFTVGAELAFDPLTYAGFVGYAQKANLLPVQRALVAYLLTM